MTARQSGTTRHRTGRVMGLDIGSHRIGVAVADETGTIASPIAVVRRDRSDHRELQRLVHKWNIDRVIVGLPTGMSGREGPQAADVRAYATSLENRFAPAIPIEFWDERLTTIIAERSMIASGTRRAQRKERIDAIAAAVILQGWLDAGHHRRRRASIDSTHS